MTVSTNDNKAFANGNGVTTVFYFTYRLLRMEDLEVYVDENLKSPPSDYSVQINTNGVGGSVTFTSAPATGTNNVLLYRFVDYLQETHFPNESDFDQRSLENAVDKLTMECQQLQEELDRTAKSSLFDPLGLDLQLPRPASRRALLWHPSENGHLINSTYDPDESAVLIANALAAANAALAAANAALAAANAALATVNSIVTHFNNSIHIPTGAGGTGVALAAWVGGSSDQDIAEGSIPVWETRNAPFDAAHANSTGTLKTGFLLPIGSIGQVLTLEASGTDSAVRPRWADVPAPIPPGAGSLVVAGSVVSNGVNVTPTLTRGINVQASGIGESGLGQWSVVYDFPINADSYIVFGNLGGWAEITSRSAFGFSFNTFNFLGAFFDPGFFDFLVFNG